MMKKIRLLLADDHAVLRAGLRMLLDAQPDMEVVGEAADGEETVERVLELKPDVVLMDIAMGGMNGITATREIERRLPQTRILVLTMHDDEEYLRQMLEAGASGYVLKRAADTELIAAIRAVQRDEIFLYPAFVRVLLGDLIGRKDSDDPRQKHRQDVLSRRETEVLQLVALGYTNKQIAARLFLSVKTVESYRARIMGKLGLKSRAALVRYALRKGFLNDALRELSDETGGEDETET